MLTQFHASRQQRSDCEGRRQTHAFTPLQSLVQARNEISASSHVEIWIRAFDMYIILLLKGAQGSPTTRECDELQEVGMMDAAPEPPARRGCTVYGVKFRDVSIVRAILMQPLGWCGRIKRQFSGNCSLWQHGRKRPNADEASF
jgi:hypothetical protein